MVRNNNEQGTIADEWVNFLTNGQIIKTMICADSDIKAIKNTWQIELNYSNGIFDIQEIMYLPELKVSGKLSALEMQHMTSSITFLGIETSAKKFKQKRQQDDWIPVKGLAKYTPQQILYAGMDAIIALHATLVFITCRPELVYRICNESMIKLF